MLNMLFLIYNAAFFDRLLAKYLKNFSPLITFLRKNEEFYATDGKSGPKMGSDKMTIDQPSLPKVGKDRLNLGTLN